MFPEKKGGGGGVSIALKGKGKEKLGSVVSVFYFPAKKGGRIDSSANSRGGDEREKMRGRGGEIKSFLTA